MRKLLAIILVMALCFSFCACGGNSESTESVEDKVIFAVEARINAHIILQYDTTGVPDITCYIDEIGEDEFEVTGKITVSGKYGGTYTGNYAAFVKYYPEIDDCSIISCDIDKLYSN